ncbi:hypothetical protein DT076_05275 [Desertihabitans brevis]|uniref:Peptidase M15C domain-containing protein n=1 Tax=Desertihabitans brevis TaxID=2268447 RepID=A0A367YY28_9ACTN|nr:M15 family metallopeptidase [Desertihabitans brevis]RCK70803.1 hypothetical protein DT076_05275 [Desertihabitans brevis]
MSRLRPVPVLLLAFVLVGTLLPTAVASPRLELSATAAVAAEDAATDAVRITVAGTWSGDDPLDDVTLTAGEETPEAGGARAEDTGGAGTAEADACRGDADRVVCTTVVPGVREGEECHLDLVAVVTGRSGSAEIRAELDEAVPVEGWCTTRDDGVTPPAAPASEPAASASAVVPDPSAPASPSATAPSAPSPSSTPTSTAVPMPETPTPSAAPTSAAPTETASPSAPAPSGPGTEVAEKQPDTDPEEPGLRSRSRAAAPAETPIARRYRETGGADGPLGAVVAAERPVAGGRYARYEGGHLYQPPGADTAWIVRGAVLARYTALGGPAESGFPSQDEWCGLPEDGCLQKFDRAWIYWSPGAGAHPVTGAIRSAYGRHGWERGPLGFPTQAEWCGLRDGGCLQKFTGGTVYWSSGTGAHPVWGAVLGAYGRAGWERGALRMPVEDEWCGLRGGGCLQKFQGGTVYWSPGTGAHPVWGSILGAYGRAGWERGTLGFPIQAEWCGLVDGGCLQKFTGGSIYWSPFTGAHAVWGAILTHWAGYGYERSVLGYPDGDERCSGGTCTQTFDEGRITWSRSAGARATSPFRYVTLPVSSADVRHTYRAGCPVGPSRLRKIVMLHRDQGDRLRFGEMIVRDFLADDVVAAFRAAYERDYPIARMDNPNVWKGDDPDQMAANNTSGFNCRKVVGNPYAVSPHSYGTALDVNPVQNPYQDANGRWWPSNGKGWILGGGLNRPKEHPAVLTTGSTLTDALEDRGFFWGGRWANRDYQHFEY